MRQITIYKLHEHQNKDICLKWIRSHFSEIEEDLILDNYLFALKELRRLIGGYLTYKLSLEPESDEYVKIEEYTNSEMLRDLYHIRDKYPLTGKECDKYIIEGIYTKKDTIIIDAIHRDYTKSITDEYLIATYGEYEFFENGTRTLTI